MFSGVVMCKVIGVRVKDNKLDMKGILNKVQYLSKEKNITIQLFDARYIYGSDHLISAFEHAKRAFDQGRAHSDTLAMEILLYAAGEYQIKNALEKVGVNEDTSGLAIIIAGESKDQNVGEILKEISLSGPEILLDDEVLIGDNNTLEQFGITKKELAAVPEDKWLDLVLEKVAMVDIKK